MEGLVEAMKSSMKGLVGEVQERQPSMPPAPPTLPAAVPPGAAFPAASHRKQSRFALARQPKAGPAAAPAAPAPQTAAAPLLGTAAAGGDHAAIDAENRMLLAHMSAEQLEEARAEVLARLPPQAVEFLKRRGAAGREGGERRAQPAQAQARTRQEPTREAQAAAPHMQAQRQQQQQQQQRFQPARSTLGAVGDGGAAGQAAPPLASRLLFDIHGAVVGLQAAEETGWGGEAVLRRNPLEVVDSSGEGRAGYTLAEACTLARSSLAQQRQLALRLLGAVLAAARPRASASTASSSGRSGGAQPVRLPEAAAAQLAAEAAAGGGGGGVAPQRQLQALDWTDVWRYALHAAEVAMVLRLALDDSHLPVIAAAAEALAALLGAAGPGAADEEAAAEAADACPLTGWPAAPARHLQRQDGTSAWLAAPTRREERARAAAGGGEAGEEEEGHEPLDERQLAKVDPLSALLHTDLLRRACYVLETVRAPGAVEPLLAILIRCCQAGKDVTETDGLEGALRAVLSAPAPGEAAGAAEAAYAAARPLVLRLLRQLAQASKAAARLLLDRGLVRCALDELLRPTLRLRGGDADAAAAAAAAAAPGEPAAAPAQRCRELGMRTEALRLWRCLAMHDLYLLHLDDAYPGLCRCFEPVTVATAAALGADGSHGGGTAAQEGAEGPAAELDAELELEQLAVAREAYLLASALCWQAAASDGGGMISAECAAGLERQAAGWLAALPAKRLLQACAQATAGLVHSAGATQAEPEAAAMPRQARLSACPALPAPLAAAAPDEQRRQAAIVLVSTLAAVLQFEVSFWSTGAPQGRPAAAQELQHAGWLPTPGAGSGPLLAAHNLLQAAAPLAAAGGSAGGVLAAAACDLGLAAARLEAVLLHTSGGAAALLAPLRSQATVAALLAAAAERDSTLQQPWDAAGQQCLLALARAALASLQAAAAVDPEARPAAQADLALALLQALPPGAEADALQALGLLLSSQQAAAARAAADAALDASGGIGELAGGDRPALPPARQLAAGALAGYAAAWLGLLPSDPLSLQQQGAGRAGEQQQQLPGPAAAFLQPPPTTAALCPGDSRLPLPPEWALLEAPLLPAAGANLAAAAGTALLLALGWEQLGPASLARVPPGAKLKAAVQLVFGERPVGGTAPEPAAGGDTAREEPWQQPLARWCLAALMRRHCEAEAPAGGAGVPAQSPWKHQEAKQLAERYASESFGHPLFGAAVALLLRVPVPLDTQLEVLQTLADERALHLLPPVLLLPGPAMSYLDAPLPAPAAAAAGPGAPGASSASSPGAAAEAYLKLLAEGQLERCLGAYWAAAGAAAASPQASTGNGRGLSLGLALLLHRLAAYLFGSAGDAAVPSAEQAQRSALLRAAVRRCGSDAGKRQLLGMLLRWDAAAGAPSDMVPAGRMAALEAACSVDSEGDELFAAVQAALED